MFFINLGIVNQNNGDKTMSNINKDWFDTHVEVMTLNDDKEQEQKSADHFQRPMSW